MEDAQSSMKIVSGIWEQLINAPAHLLLLVLLLVIGILIKKSPTPNWCIPWILMLIGGLGYPNLASPKNINPDFPNPNLVLAIYGILLGIGAVVAHIFLRKLAWFRTIELGILNAFRDDEDKIKPPGEVDPTKPDSKV